MQYITHHGIKGQRWGVRRFQNYDGSYTRKGLERYRDSKEKYDNASNEYSKAKALYKQGEINKNEFSQYKNEYKQSKRELNKRYDQLKKDKLADKGKDLYTSGKTINSYNTKQGFYNLGALAAGTAAGLAVAATGKRVVAKIGDAVFDAPAGAVAAYAAIGAAAIGGAVYFGNKRKQLRAYYGHSGN